MFYVGQPVVHIGLAAKQEWIDKWRARGAVYPRVGEVYIIREIVPWKQSSLLLLQEIDNSHISYSEEPGFSAEAFRPLTDQKKSVSFTIGADPDSERWDNRRKVVEPFPVDGWS